MLDNSLLVINASPNKKGNTSLLLDTFLKGAGVLSQVVYPYEKSVKPCIDCKYCRKNKGVCVFQDDMTELYNLIRKCSNIVIASPLYFGNYPAPMKAIIDRMQVFWSEKYVYKAMSNSRKKRGILLSTAGVMYPNMFESLEKTTQYVFGITNTELYGKVLITNTDKLPLRLNDKAMEEVFDLGRKFSSELLDEE